MEHSNLRLTGWLKSNLLLSYYGKSRNYCTNDSYGGKLGFSISSKIYTYNDVCDCNCVYDIWLAS